MQTTGMKRDVKDKFYTTSATAEFCISLLQPYNFKGQWIEPSAGGGSFLNLVPGAIGYDIEPFDFRVLRRDFFSVNLPQDCVVFGNPPFGRQSSTAKKFIKYASEKASVIAFILPKSFEKPSMQTCFPMKFHCLQSVELPENSFTVNNKPYNVPCIFQVWKRQESDRVLVEKIKPIGFEFVKKHANPNLVIRRVGVNAGKCSLFSDQSRESHYFLIVNDSSKISRIIEQSKIHVFPSNTVGPKSLSKSEICEFLNTLTSS